MNSQQCRDTRSHRTHAYELRDGTIRRTHACELRNCKIHKRCASSLRSTIRPSAVTQSCNQVFEDPVDDDRILVEAGAEMVPTPFELSDLQTNATDTFRSDMESENCGLLWTSVRSRTITHQVGRKCEIQMSRTNSHPKFFQTITSKQRSNGCRDRCEQCWQHFKIARKNRPTTDSALMT